MKVNIPELGIEVEMTYEEFLRYTEDKKKKTTQESPGKTKGKRTLNG
jgi:hypothetical protein